MGSCSPNRNSAAALFRRISLSTAMQGHNVSANKSPKHILPFFDPEHRLLRQLFQNPPQPFLMFFWIPIDRNLLPDITQRKSAGSVAEGFDDAAAEDSVGDKS